MIKRKHLPKYESLSYLVRGLTPGVNLDARARIGSYWRNTIKVRAEKAVGSGLLLTRDGYFATNYHVLTEERERAGCSIVIPQVNFPFKVSKTVIRSRLHDLVLAKADVTSVFVPTEIIFSDSKPSLTDKVRTYGYRNNMVEEKQGSICRGYNHLFSDRWRRLGVSEVNLKLQEIAELNTLYSTCDIEPGWSGGPVILENTGELLGFTKFIATTSDIHQFAGLIPKKYQGYICAGKLKEMIYYFLEKEE